MLKREISTFDVCINGMCHGISSIIGIAKRPFCSSTCKLFVLFPFVVLVRKQMKAITLARGVEALGWRSAVWAKMHIIRGRLTYA